MDTGLCLGRASYPVSHVWHLECSPPVEGTLLTLTPLPSCLHVHVIIVCSCKTECKMVTSLLD